PAQNGPKFFESALNALPRCLLAQPECLAHSPEFASFKEAEEKGLALALLQLVHRSIDGWHQLLPARVCSGRDLLHGDSLLLAGSPSLFASDHFGSGKMRAGVEPSCQRIPVRQGPCLPRKICKDRLGNVAGQF